MKTCLYCKKELIGKKIKFCSTNCQRKNYYINNKDDFKKRKDKYIKNNKDKIRKYNREYMKKYYLKNEEFRNKVKKSSSKYTYKKNIRLLTRRIKEDIFKIKGNKCEKCNSDKDIELHHIDYIWYNMNTNGKDIKNLKKNIDNTKVLCRKCHRETHRQNIYKRVNTY